MLSKVGMRCSCAFHVQSVHSLSLPTILTIRGSSLLYCFRDNSRQANTFLDSIDIEEFIAEHSCGMPLLGKLTFVNLG